MEQAAAAQPDLEIQASFKCRESIWKRMKIEAIRRGCTVAKLAEVSFERTLTDEERSTEMKGRRR